MMKTDPDTAWLQATKGSADQILDAKRSKDALRGSVTRQVNSIGRFNTLIGTMINEATTAGTSIPRATITSVRQEASDMLREVTKRMHNAEEGTELYKAIAGLDVDKDNEEIKLLETALETLQINVDKAKGDLTVTLSNLADPSQPTGGAPALPTNTPRFKLVDPLKPRPLEVGACPKTVERWFNRFIAYYTESHCQAATLKTQREVLKDCLSEQLGDRIFNRATASTPVDPTGYLEGDSYAGPRGFLHYIRSEFEDAVPTFNRLEEQTRTI